MGVTRAVLYKWKNPLLGEEAPCSKMEAAPKNTTDDVDALRSQAAELQDQIKRLELRKAILEGTVELLGKGQSVDPGMLTNREKALLANSLRPARKLNEMLSGLGMGRSSCQYQVEAMRRPDKHAGPRRRISEIFAASNGRYGYRRIRLGPRSEGVRVSEKVVARLMRELDLVAKRGKKRRYSSYKGEISDAPENLVKRNFHADAPNKLWLTDIAEFRIPAGKVYLSPVVDCFDGMVVSWAMSTSPNAELANAMLVLRRRDAVGGRAPGRTHRPRVPLPLAGLDREVREVRHHEVDVEEGLLPGQQRLRGFLRTPEGRAVLRQKLERVERRRLHGRGRSLHPLVQRAAEQGIARRMSPLQYRRSLNLAA